MTTATLIPMIHIDPSTGSARTVEIVRQSDDLRHVVISDGTGLSTVAWADLSDRLPAAG